ncbi:glycosyltransferase family 9 protein [Endothiovibrio diazotrophicus]
MSEILITRFSALGDLVTLEPMLRALRTFHRDDTITFLTSGIGEALYGERFERCLAYPQRSSGRWRQAGELKRQLEALTPAGRFERVYDIQASTLSLLTALRLRKGRLVNQSTRLSEKLMGRKARGLTTPELLRAAGFPEERIDAYWSQPASRTIALPVPEAEAARFEEQFAARARPVAVIAPGASERWSSKQWGEARFAELAVRLDAAGYTVAVIGSQWEQAAAAQIVERLPEALDFTARTGIRELVGLLSRASLFVGNDSGPAHLAAGVALPTVTLFGPTGEMHCAGRLPYRGEHACLTPHDIPCHPCYKPVCPTERECLASIPVDEVLATALAIARPSPPPLR